MDDITTRKYPRELLAALEAKFQIALETVTKDTEFEKDILTFVSTFLLTQLGIVIQTVNVVEGVKEAKKIREILSQRLHAYPIEDLTKEKKND